MRVVVPCRAAGAWARQECLCGAKQIGRVKGEKRLINNYQHLPYELLLISLVPDHKFIILFLDTPPPTPAQSLIATSASDIHPSFSFSSLSPPPRRQGIPTGT
jgi:hypothetical protein